MVNVLLHAFYNLAITSESIAEELINRTDILECSAFLVSNAKLIDGEIACRLADFINIVCSSMIMTEKGIEYVIDTIYPLMFSPNDLAVARSLEAATTLIRS